MARPRANEPTIVIVLAWLSEALHRWKPLLGNTQEGVCGHAWQPLSDCIERRTGGGVALLGHPNATLGQATQGVSQRISSL